MIMNLEDIRSKLLELQQNNIFIHIDSEDMFSKSHIKINNVVFNFISITSSTITFVIDGVEMINKDGEWIK
jgi:hypothetical protein